MSATVISGKVVVSTSRAAENGRAMAKQLAWRGTVLRERALASKRQKRTLGRSRNESFGDGPHSAVRHSALGVGLS